VACLADARLQGRSELIGVAGRVLLDVQDHELERLDDEIEWDPTVFHAEGMRVWCMEPPDASQPLEVDTAFTLLGAHTDFFGHWMCEYLPKYVAARLSGALPDVPVLIDAHMPRSHCASLELLHGPSCPLIEVPAFRAVRVHRLWCAPALSYMPLHEIRNERFSWDAISASPSRFRPVIQEMQRRFYASANVSNVVTPRVYFARKSFRHRRLVNSEAIDQVALDLGFTIAYPEDSTFSEQAAMARTADTIIAPEGSAIFLGAFGRPGTTLCVLSHPLTDVLADYSGLFSLHGIRTVAVTGPITCANPRTPNDADYRIDERRFRRVVEMLVRAERR
jgi:capsular polysaccharide biosynthesis protein